MEEVSRVLSGGAELKTPTSRATVAEALDKEEGEKLHEQCKDDGCNADLAALVEAFTGSDVTPRAAMALGLHRLAARVSSPPRCTAVPA